MKYSDQQRIEKMRETTEKLLRYVEKKISLPRKFLQKKQFNGPLQHRSTTLESTLLIYQRTQEAISGYSMGEDCRTAAQAGASL